MFNYYLLERWNNQLIRSADDDDGVMSELIEL